MMSTSIKILFTLPALVEVFYILSFAFPLEFNDLYSSWTRYYILMWSRFTIQLLVAIILIRRVWSYKNIERKRKWNWTWFFVFMGNIAVLFYVWGQDGVFLKENSTPPLERCTEQVEVGIKGEDKSKNINR